jgi:hypothetical protein
MWKYGWAWGARMLAGCGDKDEETAAPIVDSPHDSEAETGDQPGDSPGDTGDSTGDSGGDTGCDELNYWTDADGDSFGDPARPTRACAWSEGLSDNDRDCDDGDPDVFPWAMEGEDDGVDSDCDGFDDPTTTAAMGTMLWASSAGSQAGYAVAGAGDVNGDGNADLIVGGPGDDGGAWLIHGPITGPMDLDDAAAHFATWGTSNHAGAAVAGAGDVNGDGFDDLLIGAYGRDPYHGGSAGYLAGAGEVMLALGPVSGALELYSDTIRIPGLEEDQSLGSSVAGLGDTDGDGYDDWAVGSASIEYETGPSNAWVVLGGDQAPAALDEDAINLYWWPNTGSGAAETLIVGAAGDLDGDGLGDLALSCPATTRAWIVNGPISGTIDLEDADSTLLVIDGNDTDSGVVSGGGDSDGDGSPELLLGFGSQEIDGDYAGVVYLVSGPVGTTLDLADAAAILEGTQGHGSTGSAAQHAGDLDEDGKDEILIGDAGVHYDGAAHLVFGAVSGHHNLHDVGLRVMGADGDDNAGIAVSAGADLDGDGVPDLVVGASQSDAMTEDAGAVYLLAGSLFADWRAAGGEL